MSADKAEQKAVQAKTGLMKTLEDDGVQNPAGLSMIGFGGIFLAMVPVTQWLAQSGGFLERGVNGVISSVAFIGSAGSTSAVAQTGKIAALSSLYIAFTFGLTGAASVAGATAGNKEGRDNKYPRKNLHNLTGLPLRLHSAHYNLIEMFGGFALSAALAQAIAPGDQAIINLLGLHVIAKVFVYWPSYIFNVDVPRSIAHILATSSVIGVALQLSRKPIL